MVLVASAHVTSVANVANPHPGDSRSKRADRLERLAYAAYHGRSLRDAHGLLQREVAERTSLSLRTIRRYEGASFGLHAEHIWDLADLYGVSADVIIGRRPLPDWVRRQL